MIVTSIIFIAYNLLNWLIGILPSSTGFPVEAHEAMLGLGSKLSIFTPILPMQTLTTLLTLVFGVEIAIFSFKGVKWIISHIPQVGGKGN